MRMICQQRGFSLIELLVSLVVGLFVLAGILQVFTASFRASSESVRYSNLNEQTRAVTGAVSRELRRAGYWAGSINDLGTGTSSNPFSMLSVVDQDGDDVGDCVLYGYDADDSGESAAGSHAATEWRGFRFNAGTNSIEVTTAGGSQANVIGADCSDDAWTWSDFVNPNVLEVTDMRLTLTPVQLLVETVTNCPGSPDEQFWVEVRTIALELDGQLANDAEAARSTATTVRVRNDRLFTQTVACS